MIPIFEEGKGYDAEELRDKLLRRKIFSFIPYRRIGAAKKAQIIVCKLAKQRWKVERAIAWLQRKHRRLVVRWERRLCYWKGFLSLGLIFFGLCRFLGYRFLRTNEDLLLTLKYDKVTLTSKVINFVAF